MEKSREEKPFHAGACIFLPTSSGGVALLGLYDAAWIFSGFSAAFNRMCDGRRGRLLFLSKTACARVRVHLHKGELDFARCLKQQKAQDHGHDARVERRFLWPVESEHFRQAIRAAGAKARTGF
jgi:hypothetical protein